MVLVDGILAPTLSNLTALEAGVRLRTLRDVLEQTGKEARGDLLDKAQCGSNDVAERGDGDRRRS